MAENLLIGLISIILLGIGAQWLAWRFKLPSILILLLAGILAGPIFNLLNPDLLLGDILTPFVSISVGIILFEGGLSLRFSELKDTGSVIAILVSIGVLVTWIISSVSAFYLFNMTMEIAILMGAILVVTGPTVIIPLLRQVRPTGQVGSVLKWEGIVIDPIGALLAILVFEIIFTSGISEATSLAVASILKTVIFGTLLGLAGAALVYFLLKRHLLPDFLQNPVTFMIVLVVFGTSHVLQHESGLWATTVMGIALANQKSARIHHIVEFKENLRVLLLSALFILLAARVELQNLVENLNWQIVAFLAILIFIARPLTVFLSTIKSNFPLKEKLFLSWMAPRGVVAASISSLFALELVNYGYDEAQQMIPIVFIVIIATVSIYGLTASPVARLLKVAKPSPKGLLILGAHRWGRKIAKKLKNENFKVIIADSNYSNIQKARKDGLETYHGNILAEYTLDEINLDGIGKLLALTHNDETNTLAAIRFADIFGTSEVFQLPAISDTRRKEREVTESLGGRVLFGERYHFDLISDASDKSDISSVVLSEQQTIDDVADQLEKKIIPLFAITENHEAKPYTVDTPPALEQGDKLIFIPFNENQDNA